MTHDAGALSEGEKQLLADQVLGGATPSTLMVRAVERILADRAEALRGEVERLRALHRDLVSRLGFGDNITEPMADNDAIVKWFEEQGRDASEWQESQLWRNDCYEAGHPDDEDCYEHDPARRLERAEAKVARVEALVDEVCCCMVGRFGHAGNCPTRQLRAALEARDV